MDALDAVGLGEGGGPDAVARSDGDESRAGDLRGLDDGELGDARGPEDAQPQRLRRPGPRRPGPSWEPDLVDPHRAVLVQGQGGCLGDVGHGQGVVDRARRAPLARQRRR